MSELSQFKVMEVKNTFKQSLNLTATARLCKISRNTVRRIIRADLPKHPMIRNHRNSEALKCLPSMNPKSSWNPNSSKLFQSLQSMRPGQEINPQSLITMSNTIEMMKTIGTELNIGESAIKTLKLELLVHEYLIYSSCLARASAVMEDIGLPIDKKIRLYATLIETAHRSFSKITSLICEFEGVPSRIDKVSISQNNINVAIRES